MRVRVRVRISVWVRVRVGVRVIGLVSLASVFRGSFGLG